MPRKNRLTVAGQRLAHTIEQLISRGDVRRVCIMDEERSLLEVPVALGDPAAPAAVLKAPVLAAIKAFGTLVNECTIEVESAEETNK
ncbi:MAG: hypothetical protein A2147_02120 [Chloroflexi bacterium RBG_16_57_8]|nr:MAG: hypothetical protein A2147_02120 [Chloroflexi bacterium RBG_16_57_8]